MTKTEELIDMICGADADSFQRIVKAFEIISTMPADQLRKWAAFDTLPAEEQDRLAEWARSLI